MWRARFAGASFGVTGGERDAEPASPLALIASARPLRLVQAYGAITDDGVRRSLIALTQAIARLSEGGPVRQASRRQGRRKR